VRVGPAKRRRGAKAASLDDALVVLAPSGRHHLGEILLPAKSAIPVRLHVYIPEGDRDHDYQVALRQLFDGDEVGRVTWQLTSRVGKG